MTFLARPAVMTAGATYPNLGLTLGQEDFRRMMLNQIKSDQAADRVQGAGMKPKELRFTDNRLEGIPEPYLWSEIEKVYGTDYREFQANGLRVVTYKSFEFAIYDDRALTFYASLRRVRVVWNGIHLRKQSYKELADLYGVKENSVIFDLLDGAVRIHGNRKTGLVSMIAVELIWPHPPEVALIAAEAERQRDLRLDAFLAQAKAKMQQQELP
jgi:hypothetical protein